MMITKMMNMFLKKKRKEKKFKDSKKKKSVIVNVVLSENKNENKAAERFIYKICDRLYNDVCYIERSNLASD